MVSTNPSHVHGPSDVALLGTTIGDLFDDVVSRQPTAEALVIRHQKVRWTYRDLQAQVDGAVMGGQCLGLPPRHPGLDGDPVSVPNSWDRIRPFLPGRAGVGPGPGAAETNRETARCARSGLIDE